MFDLKYKGLDNLKLISGIALVLFFVLMFSQFVFAGCWGIDGVCNSECNYSGISSGNVYGMGCNFCPIMGSIYYGQGSCSANGTGSCYLLHDVDEAPDGCIAYPPLDYTCGGGDYYTAFVSGALSGMSYDSCSWIDDPCSCPGFGNNWVVNLSDSCVSNVTCDLRVGNLSFVGSGNFTCDSVLSVNMLTIPAGGTIYIKNDCVLSIGYYSP